MKIGILTFHCAHNYGAVLQAYALQEKIREMGHEVEIIDYRPDYLVDPYKILNIKILSFKNPIQTAKLIMKFLFTVRKRKKRYDRFDYFISNYLYLSIPLKNNVLPVKDAYIIGSDQIWNKNITNGFDEIYWGNFDVPKNTRRISYAASMGIINQLDNSDFYNNALSNFNSISVREARSMSLLQPLTNTKIETVLDPTLLTDIEFWDKLAKETKINQKYILIYEIRTYSESMQIAKNIAKRINAIIIRVTSSLSWRSEKNTYQCASPEQFLGLIKHAEYIITTSFHGTVFSILFNRPFFSLDFSNDSRIQSLLTILGLETRLVNSSINESFDELYKEQICWGTINLKLIEQREKSVKYLAFALTE